MSTKLPRNLYRYFWDIEPEKIDPLKRPLYVLAHLFEYGDIDALRWIFKNFSKHDMQKALKRRDVSKRTRTFWNCYIKHQMRGKK